MADQTIQSDFFQEIREVASWKLEDAPGLAAISDLMKKLRVPSGNENQILRSDDGSIDYSVWLKKGSETTKKLQGILELCNQIENPDLLVKLFRWCNLQATHLEYNDGTELRYYQSKAPAEEQSEIARYADEFQDLHAWHNNKRIAPYMPSALKAASIVVDTLKTLPNGLYPEDEVRSYNLSLAMHIASDFFSAESQKNKPRFFERGILHKIDTSLRKAHCPLEQRLTVKQSITAILHETFLDMAKQQHSR